MITTETEIKKEDHSKEEVINGIIPCNRRKTA